MIAARNHHQGGRHGSLGVELSSCQLLACQIRLIGIASIDQDGMPYCIVAISLSSLLLLP